MSDMLNLPQDPTITPEDDAVSSDETPIAFQGFASPQSLMIERPSRYVERIREATKSMILIPDGDPYGGLPARIISSPLLALPAPALFGNESFPSEDVLAYPLLHSPVNHPPHAPVDEYVLTLTVLYTMGGVLYEDGRDVFAYRLEDPFEVGAEAWGMAEDWVRENEERLATLNLARLVRFSSLPGEEQAATGLLDFWRIEIPESKRSAMVDAGRDAADRLAEPYRRLFGVELRPFED